MVVRRGQCTTEEDSVLLRGGQCVREDGTVCY